jgi:hypothetical protein
MLTQDDLGWFPVGRALLMDKAAAAGADVKEGPADDDEEGGGKNGLTLPEETVDDEEGGGKKFNGNGNGLIS